MSRNKYGNALSLAEACVLTVGDKVWYQYVKNGNVRISEEVLVNYNDGRNILFDNGYDFELGRALRTSGDLTLIPARVECHPGECTLFHLTKV